MEWGGATATWEDLVGGLRIDEAKAKGLDRCVAFSLGSNSKLMIVDKPFLNIEGRCINLEQVRTEGKREINRGGTNFLQIAT